MRVPANNGFTLPVGTKIKRRYQILSAIGLGGFGITYKVSDTYTDKIYAMKEYAPKALCVRGRDGFLRPVRIEKIESLEHGRVKFLEEADLLRQMDSIAGIVPVIDCFNENNTSYYVMQYLEGVTLYDYVKQHDGRLSIGDALQVVGAVGYALNRVHAIKGILHRDVSPDNIFITKDNDVRIIDFGNAKHTVGGEDETGSIALKPGFAPPEQYSSKGQQGSYTDVYSLAGTMYYCLTGMMIPAAPERLSGEQYIPIRQMFPEIKVSVEKAIEHALMLDHEQRTQNMEAFMNELGLDTTLYEDKVKISPYVEISKGEAVGRRYNIMKDTIITIGRSKTNDITFPKNLYISKRHCELSYDSEQDKFFIEDYSTNGTFIDGKKIEQGKLHEMQPGQTFVVGDKNTVLRVGVMHV
jgi:serine/threonine protein kinase